jgi:pimeloyl-ACP methyl ester carboxylesterase
MAIDMKPGQESVFDTGKVKINFLSSGPELAEPLIMLHGGAWSWQEFLSLIPHLAENWRVYALDLRGNGKSEWLPGHYCLEDFTDDTFKFIENLDSSVVLIGHSIGGVVGLMTAARCPGRVKALIIEDAPLSLDNYSRLIDAGRDMFRLWLNLKQSAKSETELALSLAHNYKDYKGMTSTWITFFSTCLWRLDPDFFDSLLNDFDRFSRGYDYRQILSQINCPTLFITGDTALGSVMTQDEMSYLNQNMENVKSVSIQGVGHLLHLQDLGQKPVLNEMMSFLADIRQTQ